VASEAKNKLRLENNEATVERMYALLRENRCIGKYKMVDIKIGDKVIDPTKLEDTKIEAAPDISRLRGRRLILTPRWVRLPLPNRMKELALGRSLLAVLRTAR